MCARDVVFVLFTTIVLALAQPRLPFAFTRVLGGAPTTISQYPILAQLLLDPWATNQYSQHCAGVILTSRHVISTAHCFQYNENTGRNYTKPYHWKVRVGSSYRTRGGVLHRVKNIIPHPSFDKYYYKNDVAVLVVATPITMTKFARQGTITKPGTDVAASSLCTLVGWGATQRGGPQPDQLQYTMMVTIDQQECIIRYNTIGAVVTDSMFCAGNLEMDGIDGCYGDSGGPLIYKGVVVGLVSFGFGCGLRYYPGVYTKLSHFTDWIIKTIASNK
ncbi:PREDICTED: trypsin CFT-1-like [Papilio polytes]|uniref:trypsin CFT-1-like n=1 Tax=Papilio polytes TaxID=76194 RepID=UPI000676562F|nr:PREDICTED: trypsin CFT-1-like [Papilio polytes]